MFSSLRPTAALNKSIDRFKIRDELHGFVLSPSSDKGNVYDEKVQTALKLVNTTVSAFSAPEGYRWRYSPYNDNITQVPFFVPFPFDFDRQDSKHANDIIYHFQIWSWSRIQFPIKKDEFLVLNDNFKENIYSPCFTYIYLQHLQLVKDLCDELVTFPENSVIISELMSLVNISLYNFKRMIGKRTVVPYENISLHISKSLNTLQTMKYLRNIMHPLDFVSTLVYIFENDANIFFNIPGSKILADIIYLGILKNNTILWKRYQLCKVFNTLDFHVNMTNNESCVKQLITFAEARLFKRIAQLYTLNHIILKMVQVEKSGAKQLLDSIAHCHKYIQRCNRKLVLIMNSIDKIRAENVANCIAVRILGDEVNFYDLHTTSSLNVIKTIYLLGMDKDIFEKYTFEKGFMHRNEIM